jgi:hypothetical protein
MKKVESAKLKVETTRSRAFTFCFLLLLPAFKLFFCVMQD